MAAQPPPSMTRRATTHGDVYVGQYKRLESIGKGSFAVVYRAIHPADGSLLAIKTVQTNSLSTKLRQNLTSEIDILKSIKHPHVVAMIQCLESANHLHLIMEFCQLGDLATFVKKRDKLASHPVTAEMIRNYPNPPGAGFNEVIVRHFSKQLSSALEFLRSKNLVHRDLKPQNLLLNPPVSWIAKEKPENRPYEVTKDCLVPIAGLVSLPTLKIADFGFARHLPTMTLAETLCGSPLYMAPEILRYEKYDAKADLWSVGTVLYELVVGKPPFRAANHVDLLRKIERANDKIKFPDDVDITDDMKVVIRALLKKMPTERISWEGYFQSAINTQDIPNLVPSDRPKPPTVITASTERPQTPIVIRPLVDLPGTPSTLANERQEEVCEPQAEPRQRPSTPRTNSTVPITQSPLARQVPTSQPTRPALSSYPTAPAVATFVAPKPDRASSNTPVDRPKVPESSSPSSPAPRDAGLERERLLQRNREKAAKDARERAAQDIAFERDYVMVEKRAVEVNAFADELAASPQIHGSSRAPALLRPGVAPRSATTQGLNSSANRSQTPSLPGHVALRPETFHARKRSWEAKHMPSKVSATSAIAAALNTVNFRLTGGPLFPSFAKGPSPPQGYGAFPMFPGSQAGQMLLAETDRTLALDEDQKIMITIEERATRSDVVYGFAEVKYKQLAPIAPSNDNILGLRKAGQPYNTSSGSAQEDDDLTTDAIVEISEEALVLYVKTLAILQNTFNLAAKWWTQKNRGEVAGETSLSPRSIDAHKTGHRSADIRINNVVQWARNRFNECLEKSEYVSRRLSDAQRKLPANHPGHPGNHPGSESGTEDMISSGIRLSSGVTAEKLMYDRALDMNKSAAVNELMSEDLPGCEVSYLTAIRLLEAVLEKDEEQFSKHTNSSKKEKQEIDEGDSNAIDGIEEGDRRSVLNVIEITKQRLGILRKKITMRNAARRNSLKAPSTSSDPSSAVPSVPASLPARLSPRSLPH